MELDTKDTNQAPSGYGIKKPQCRIPGEVRRRKIGEKKERGHPDLNRGPLDLQSNALPLSYTPVAGGKDPSKKLGSTEAGAAKSFVRCGIRTHALIRGPEFS